MSQAGISGFGRGLMQGVQAGQEFKMNREQLKAAKRRRRALRMHEEAGVFDPDATPEEQPPPEIVEPPLEETARTWGVGEQEAGVPSVQARDAQQQAIDARPPVPTVGDRWQEHRKKVLEAGRVGGPEMYSVAVSQLEEQERKLAAMQLSRAGMAMSSGDVESAQKATDAFLSLAFPGADFRLTAVAEQVKDKDGKPVFNKDGSPRTVALLQGPDGQFVDTSALIDGLGNLDDPLKWAQAKSEMYKNRLLAEYYASMGRAAGTSTKVTELDPTISFGDAQSMAGDALTQFLEEGALTEEMLTSLDPKTREQIRKDGKVPKPLRIRWENLTAGILYSGQDDVTRAGAAELGWELVAAMQGEATAPEIEVASSRSDPNWAQVTIGGRTVRIRGEAAREVVDWYDSVLQARAKIDELEEGRLRNEALDREIEENKPPGGPPSSLGRPGGMAERRGITPPSIEGRRSFSEDARRVWERMNTVPEE